MSNKTAAKAAPRKSAKTKTATRNAKPNKRAPRKGAVGGYREGAGRPATIGADQAIGVRLPADLLERVRGRMGAVGCSLSDAVRQGLEAWLRA
jgi:hypothetical protein